MIGRTQTSTIVTVGCPARVPRYQVCEGAQGAHAAAPTDGAWPLGPVPGMETSSIARGIIS